MYNSSYTSVLSLLSISRFCLTDSASSYMQVLTTSNFDSDFAFCFYAVVVLAFVAAGERSAFCCCSNMLVIVSRQKLLRNREY